jgi:N4-gp56 family major capsid protein
MARTIVGLNDPKAVKRYSGATMLDTSGKSYWTRKFMGEGENSNMPIQRLTDLETDAGEQITYDLLAELRMAPVEGDEILENKEEKQNFYSDQVYVDQARGGVNTGGRMTRKRTLQNLRERARRQQSNWWAQIYDQQFFMYLSGARGINENFVFPTNYTGRANNPFSAPDSQHYFVGGSATAFNNITAADKFDLNLVNKMKTRADMQGGGASDTTMLQTCNIGGEDTFVMVISPLQEDDMRSNIAVGQFLDLNKATAAYTGTKNPIFGGSLGIYRDVVLHKHRNVIRFGNAGAGGNVQAARALMLGAQAGVVAYGSPGNNERFSWYEESRDNGNQVVITTSCIFGIKKTTFNGMDFGVFTADTAAASR